MSNIESQFYCLKANIRKNPYPDYNHRIDSLRKIRKVLTSRVDEISNVVKLDFGKPYSEVLLTEIVTVVHEIDFHIKYLKKWMKSERVAGNLLTFPSRSEIHSVPYGVCLIIGAWNYPIHLLFMPLIGALSAGNRVVLKPSELASNTSRWIKNVLDSAFSADEVLVIEGGADVNKELLDLPFDKIFFTGSTRVGQIVMEAAAQKLIPVTLELGGKSPAIIFDDANMEVSAKRIWFGKCINAGQTCVAPDFLLIPESKYNEFVSYSKRVLDDFYPHGYNIQDDYTQIISKSHFDRLKRLMDNTETVFGGNSEPEQRFIEPTLVKMKGWDHPLMQEEIFGPILPVLTYKNEEELRYHLDQSRNPLACYLFTESATIAEKWIKEYQFGGGCVNDTLSHLGNSRLPFGGVGKSGTGSYHGKTSFDVFSHKKSVLIRNTWMDSSLRYQPFNRLNRMLNYLIK
jgi:aldehyde dehydrogenase (NAD+)